MSNSSSSSNSNSNTETEGRLQKHNSISIIGWRGAARQPLFSLSNSVPIYVCMYVCAQIFAAAKRRATAWSVA